jgi:hypothetical protein
MPVAFAVERFGGVVKVCPPETFPETLWGFAAGMAVAFFFVYTEYAV